MAAPFFLMKLQNLGRIISLTQRLPFIPGELVTPRYLSCVLTLRAPPPPPQPAVPHF